MDGVIRERMKMALNGMVVVALIIDENDEVLEDAGLRHDAITIRMTGCPNGCARPYMAELGFVGSGYF